MALAQPWVISLFRRLFRQGMVEIVETGNVEVTFSTFGAMISTQGTKSSHADLAVGVLAEDVGAVGDAGAVNVLDGSSAGLTATGDQFFHQDSAGVLDTAEADDEFGRSLAPRR
ncbi:MAG TPA: hypothetical protein VGR13_04295 [Actinomycetota bacterium]|nr:hypothetical protein [Actinomycetota bacterium]